MAHASIEVGGPNFEDSAGELRAALMATAGPGDRVAPVEVERSAELVVAVIGLMFAGVSSAKTIWDWWVVRRPTGVTVNIVLEDGAELHLPGLDEATLEAELRRRLESGQ